LRRLFLLVGFGGDRATCAGYHSPELPESHGTLPRWCLRSGKWISWWIKPLVSTTFTDSLGGLLPVEHHLQFGKTQLHKIRDRAARLWPSTIRRSSILATPRESPNWSFYLPGSRRSQRRHLRHSLGGDRHRQWHKRFLQTLYCWHPAGGRQWLLSACQSRYHGAKMRRISGGVRQAGFSLIELLVALGIFLLVTGAAFHAARLFSAALPDPNRRF